MPVDQPSFVLFTRKHSDRTELPWRGKCFFSSVALHTFSVLFSPSSSLMLVNFVVMLKYSDMSDTRGRQGNFDLFLEFSLKRF